MGELNREDYYLQTKQIVASSEEKFDEALNGFLKSLGDARLVVKVHDVQKDTIYQYTTIEYLVKK